MIYQLPKSNGGAASVGKKLQKFVFLTEPWASNLTDISNSWKLNYKVIWKRAHVTNNNFLAFFLRFSLILSLSTVMR